jgi:4'-phosphopantetheinyl transferase EntD
MVCRDRDGTLGIDLEDYSPERPGITTMVLRESERSIVASLPEDVQWMATLQRFSMKEAVYKALDPYVQRYVGFHEAEVIPELNGIATVALHLKHGEGPFDVDARYTWLAGRLLCTVRIRPDR